MTHGQRSASVVAAEARVGVGLAPTCVGDAGCPTCGDVASKVLVLAVDVADSLALCLDEGERRLIVDTGLVEGVVPGDALLVHAGAALIRMPA
jgi:hypothetical protein